MLTLRIKDHTLEKQLTLKSRQQDIAEAGSGRLGSWKKVYFWHKTHKSRGAAIDFVIRARKPLGKWAVTDFPSTGSGQAFSRSCGGSKATFGNGLLISTRRRRPG